MAEAAVTEKVKSGEKLIGRLLPVAEREESLPFERVRWQDIGIQDLVLNNKGEALSVTSEKQEGVVLQWKEMTYKDSYPPGLPEIVIIACHGFLANPEPYVRLMRMMGDLRGKVNFKMVAINMPGHGMSSAGLTFQQTIDAVYKIPAVKKAKHLGVMGSSMGGALAIGLTLADDRVEMGVYDNPVQDKRLRFLEAVRMGLIAGLDAIKSMAYGRENNAQIERDFPTADIPIVLGACNVLSKIPFKIAQNYFATIPNFDAQLEELGKYEQNRPFVANFIWSEGDTATQNYRSEFQERMKKLTRILGGGDSKFYPVKGGHTHGYRYPGNFFTLHREAIFEFVNRVAEMKNKL